MTGPSCAGCPIEADLNNYALFYYAKAAVVKYIRQTPVGPAQPALQLDSPVWIFLDFSRALLPQGAYGRQHVPPVRSVAGCWEWGVAELCSWVVKSQGPGLAAFHRHTTPPLRLSLRVCAGARCWLALAGGVCKASSSPARMGGSQPARGAGRGLGRLD